MDVRNVIVHIHVCIRNFNTFMLGNPPILHLYQVINCGYSTGVMKRERDRTRKKGERKTE